MSSVYLGAGEQIPGHGGAVHATPRGGPADTDPDWVYAKTIVTEQWKQYEQALVRHGEMSPDEAKAHCKAGLVARLAELRQNYSGETPKKAVVASTGGMPEGLHRDYTSIIHFGRPSYTVDPASPAAEAIRQTPQYKAAYKEGVAYQKAVEAAEAKAAGRPVRPDAVCEASCDEFALNAAANGWLIGEKLEASTDHYTPQVADNQRDHLGGQPLDVHSLSAAPATQSPRTTSAPWERAQEMGHTNTEPQISHAVEPA